jgi:environmental stress-induced protein Ves
VRRWRAVDQPRVRWRNDGGWTREIVCEPDGGAAFHWRVSIAEVESSGPFSTFEQCERVLVLLDGVGMQLRRTDTGALTTVHADAPLARFAGDVPIYAELLDGPTTDFNLIWRSDLFAVDAHCCTGCAEFTGGGAGQLVGGYVMRGSAIVNDATIDRGEMFVGDAGELLRVDSDGSLVHFLVGPIGG